MKLLFDHNLSFKLIDKIPSQFKESTHVYHLNLNEADDLVIWKYAEKHNFTLITKDIDFFDFVSLRGFPPKVIWIKRGNCSTNEIAMLITESTDKISLFVKDNENGVLIID